MNGFGSFSDFFGAQMGPLLGIGGFLLFALALLFISGVSRQRRMTSSRAGEDVDTFVLHLASYGFDPELARETYLYLTTEENVSFPIRHTDRLDNDLRISDEETHRMIAHLLRLFDREAQPGMRHMPLITVEDVLRFVQACPMVSARTSGQRRAVTESSVRRAIAG